MTQSPPELAYAHELRDELRQRTSIFSGLVLFVVGQLLIFLTEVHHIGSNSSLVGLTLGLLPLAVWLFLGNRPRLSLWALILIWIALPALLSRVTQTPPLLAALVIPAVMLLIHVGIWPAVALALGASTLVLVDGISVVQFAALVIIWGGLGLSWLVLRFANAATDWSWGSYERMRELLEESRTQQLHLKEVQQDLALANSELARLSDRLRAMSRLADEARRAKEEFVANVSHELRTPLNMIIGFSEIITGNPDIYDSELPAELVADIEVIQRNSRHLASLVDDVLDLSRAEAGRMALSREYVSLREIIEAASATVRPLFESRNLSLTTEVSDDLPPVYCDRTRVRQVIINLLSNAGRYTDQGGAQVKAVRDGQTVRITVADTGHGVPKDEQTRIFEPFEQYTGGTARVVGGSGLGLAVSRRFIEMHGGKMWLQSEPGQGSIFGAVLPLDATPQLPGGEATRWFSQYESYESRPRARQAPHPVVTPRLVVLELSDTLKHILKRYEPDVEIAAVDTFAEAVCELSRLPARALVINDSALLATLPNLDPAGQLPFRTPLIQCAIPDKDEAAARLGVAAYLLKPIQPGSLLAALALVGKPIQTVLLVDDNDEARQLFTRMLRSVEWPIAVTHAENGIEALAMMRTQQPDVVLLDLVMPEMDGYAVLRAKRDDMSIRDIPVVAISALDTVSGGYMTPFLTVSRSEGINLQDFLRCVEALTAILAPPDQANASKV